ncbi:MAG: DNA polymerase III subunit beta [Brevinematales bacterium]|nr:DNA polymerase III subunit beta [Brevinematales bacterium]
MRVTVNRDEFYSLLSLASEVVTPKNPLAILVNVYLSVSEDGLVIIQGYNGEHGIKVEMTGEVTESGTILLHARKLFDVVSHISTPRIVLATEEEGNPYEVTITSPENKHIYYKLHGSYAENFPTFQEYTWENYISLSQESLRELIEMTEYAVAQETSKIFFLGFYVEESMEGWLSMVTTDGRRLALLSREYEEKKGDIGGNVIVPASLMRIVKKALSTGEVRLALRGQNVFFKIGNIYFFSSLLEGKFPNYRDVLPSMIQHTLQIPTKDFRDQLESVAVMSEGDVQKIIFDVQRNLLTLSSVHAIYGEAKASLDIEYDDEPLQFALNYKHLMDFLRVVKSEKVTLHIKSPESAMQFTLEGDEHFIYLVMPIRTL